MKVFIAQPIQPNGIEMLKKVAEVIESPEKRPLERNEFFSLLVYHSVIAHKISIQSLSLLKLLH